MQNITPGGIENTKDKLSNSGNKRPSAKKSKNFLMPPEMGSDSISNESGSSMSDCAHCEEEPSSHKFSIK